MKRINLVYGAIAVQILYVGLVFIGLIQMYEGVMDFILFVMSLIPQVIINIMLLNALKEK